jgi:hypothetical protein
MPTHSDPKLFQVNVKFGQEKNIAQRLMNKYLVLENTPNPIKIFSASALDKYKGFIFIEAMQEKHVTHAIHVLIYKK